MHASATMDAHAWCKNKETNKQNNNHPNPSVVHCHIPGATPCCIACSRLNCHVLGRIATLDGALPCSRLQHIAMFWVSSIFQVHHYTHRVIVNFCFYSNAKTVVNVARKNRV